MAGAGRRRLGVALAISATLLITVLVAFAFGFEPIVKRMMVSNARERGIVLAPGKLGVGVGWVELVGSRFSLLGVRGTSGTIERFQVDLVGLSPKQIEVKGLDVEAVGEPAQLSGDLSKWFETYRDKFVTPMHASAVSARFRRAAGEPTVVELSNAAFAPDAKGKTLDAPTVVVSGVAVGPLHAQLAGDHATLAFGLGNPAAATPPLTAELDYAAPLGKADVTLASMDASGVSTLLGVKLPLTNVKLAATLHAELPEGGPISGKLSADLQGFVPPHPRELDGIVFGSSTHVETAFAVAKDEKNVALTAASVKAGAFKLTGTGLVSRKDGHARIRLELRGNLACTAVAASAAESRLGHVVGSWIASAAHQALQGSVGVVVKIDADTGDLDHAKVAKTIGVGCGLKPLPLPKLPDFQLPDFHLPGFVLPGEKAP